MTLTAAFLSHHCLDHRATIFPVTEVADLRDREILVYFSPECWERAIFRFNAPDGARNGQVAVAVNFRIPPPPGLWMPREAGPAKLNRTHTPGSPTQIYLTREGRDTVEIPPDGGPCVLKLW